MHRIHSFGIAVLLASGSASLADVQVPAIFGDHMVLQQDLAIPVWGWADPGEKVTVAFAGKSATATGDAEGKWRVNLERAAANTAPQTLVIQGKNHLQFEDVVVGDVWICSGQSNMEMQLGNDPTHPGAYGTPYHAEEAIAAANDPDVRFFRVQRKSSLYPEKDVVGQWERCTPETARVFSAIGYFFGRDLRDQLKKPVGLIGSYWGGTAATYWASWPGLERRAETLGPVKQWVREREELIKTLPQRVAEYPRLKAQYDEDLKRWTAEVEQSPEFQEKMTAWNTEARAAGAEGRTLPPRPEPSRPRPQEPRRADNAGSGSGQFNGMIAPLIPYGIKGVIWYQGEGNARRDGYDYDAHFESVIGSWREEWHQPGDFAFLFVQLAGFGNNEACNTLEQRADGWPSVREAQSRTLQLPQTGMATAIDLGDLYNIHPRNKQEIGDRLALAARKVAGEKDLVASGPVYQSMKVEGSSVRLSFTHSDGLKIGQWPIDAPAALKPSSSELQGFALAGADHKFVWAKARIEGREVVVESPEVPQPVAVRYGWANYPLVNLYNEANLPAVPFRTDNWKP